MKGHHSEAVTRARKQLLEEAIEIGKGFGSKPTRAQLEEALRVTLAAISELQRQVFIAKSEKDRADAAVEAIASKLAAERKLR